MMIIVQPVAARTVKAAFAGYGCISRWPAGSVLQGDRRARPRRLVACRASPIRGALTAARTG